MRVKIKNSIFSDLEEPITLIFDDIEDLNHTIKMLQGLSEFKQNQPAENFLAKYTMSPNTLDMQQIKDFTKSINVVNKDFARIVKPTTSM